MRTMSLVLVCPFLLAVGCPHTDPTPVDTDPPTPAGTAWYTTCGDPVCGGYSGPYPGVDPCTTETEGDPCATEGAQCDFASECNARLVCAAEDPKDQPGGCPISKASVKRDIAYLDPAGVDRAAREALAVRLATWSYTWEDPSTPPHLGFLIDDQPTSAAVRPDDRVDLYGYTSLAIAASQAQQAQIDRLTREIELLKAQMATCAPQRR